VQILRALRHRNFRLFTFGQSISVIGTWMQQVALGWLVYRLTDSAFLLGLVAFMAQGPVFLLSPLAGELADRVSRHRIVIVTQLLAMAQALVLGTLVMTGVIQIWHILALSVALGCINGFDIPARQSFLLEMVGERADLPNAIALNSSIFNAARLIGPAIAGFAIAALGEGPVILINGFSYIAVVTSLMAMRVQARPIAAPSGDVLYRLREGFEYAFGSPPIRAILGLVAAVSLLAVPFTVLLPVVATESLGGGPRTLGMLMSATGLGALAGALTLASRSTVRGLGRVIVGSAMLFGAALAGVAVADRLLLALPLLAAAGFGMMMQMASSNTVLQTIVDDDKRGRVMSLYSMAFIGLSPLGSLLAGAVAARIGAPATIALGGAGAMMAALVFGSRLPRLRRYMRPIYERLGIIPEVATGIQAVTQQSPARPRRNDKKVESTRIGREGDAARKEDVPDSP
jgi:MFS family permease